MKKKVAKKKTSAKKKTKLGQGLIKAVKEAIKAKERPKYHDPLHIPSAQLVVWHKGKETILLNKRLLDQQNCWTNLDKIKALHSERLHLCDDMIKVKSKILLKAMDRRYTELEFKLQKLWGFPLDSKFHRFWDRPKCQCPKMDNDDAYPSGYYVIAGNCPLHGQA